MATAAKNAAAAAKAAATEAKQPKAAEPTAGDGDAKQELQPGQIAVVSIGHRFCRAGMCFTKDPTVLDVEDLPDGVLKRLQAEPNLVVTLGA